MKCRFVREQLSAYLDRELEPGLAQEVKEHLAACETCRKELDGLEALAGLLRALPRASAPEDTEREVASRIERTLLLGTPVPIRRPHVALRRVFSGAALAAALTLLALGAYVHFFLVPSSTTAPTWEEKLSLRTESPDATRSRPVAGEPAPTPLDALKDSELGEKQDRKLARAPEGETPARTSGGSGGERVATFTPAKGVGVKETPTAPEVLAKTITHGASEVVTKTPAPGATTGQSAGRVAFEIGGTTRGEPAEETDRPAPAGKPAEGLLLEANAKTNTKKPAPTEVLTLVVAADDFDVAKKRILSVADSLKIRTVSDLSFGGGAGLRRTADEEKEKTGAAAGPAATGEVREKPAVRDVGVDEYRYAKAMQAVDRSRPALVLAVEEAKLPQLVAKLAARRVTALTARAESVDADYVTSVEAENGKEAGGEMKPQAEVVAAPKPPETTRETRDVSGKDLRRVPALTTQATPAPTAPAGPAPAPADVTKRLADDKVTEKQEQAPRIVYLRIFFRHPEPAAGTKPANAPPATKQ